jgi:hypothetical protein
MRIDMFEGLPEVSILHSYNGKTMYLNDVLLDTGCSITIFDTDEIEAILHKKTPSFSKSLIFQLLEKYPFILLLLVT